MKNKKVLVSMIIVLILICVGIFVYFKFINKDNKNNNIKENKEEINKINSGELYFRINKEIIGLYDDFKKEPFSNKKIDTVDDVIAKISDKKIVVTQDKKTLDITDIGTPKFIRLVDGYNLTDKDSYVLYILNNEKDLYKVEIDIEDLSIISKEKIQENIDEFNSVEGAFNLITFSLDSNKVLLTKSGDELRLNGKSIEEFKGVVLSYPAISIIYGNSKDSSFVKIGDNELVLNALFISHDKVNSNLRNIYALTTDDDVYVFHDTNKNTYTYDKKESKLNSLQIEKDSVTIVYENGEEEKIKLFDRNYYDGKIYDFISKD